jgi:general secretion pathway protein G
MTFIRRLPRSASTGSRTVSGEAACPSIASPGHPSGRCNGFTLVELLVVMAILAVLLSIAAPRYFESVDRAKEAALRTDLRMLRDAIDQHLADTGRWPETLQALADARYLRSVPADPLTDTPTSWIVTPHPDGVTAGVYDVRSGAQGLGRDGTAYSTW